jgi:hypothetical protein
VLEAAGIEDADLGECLRRGTALAGRALQVSGDLPPAGSGAG